MAQIHSASGIQSDSSALVQENKGIDKKIRQVTAPVLEATPLNPTGKSLTAERVKNGVVQLAKYAAIASAIILTFPISIPALMIYFLITHKIEKLVQAYNEAVEQKDIQKIEELGSKAFAGSAALEVLNSIRGEVDPQILKMLLKVEHGSVIQTEVLQRAEKAVDDKDYDLLRSIWGIMSRDNTYYPLVYVINRGDFEAVKVMVGEGVKCRKYRDEPTVIGYAIKKDRLDIAEYIFDKPKLPFTADDFRELLGHGASVSFLEKMGRKTTDSAVRINVLNVLKEKSLSPGDCHYIIEGILSKHETISTRDFTDIMNQTLFAKNQEVLDLLKSSFPKCAQAFEKRKAMLLRKQKSSLENRLNYSISSGNHRSLEDALNEYESNPDFPAVDYTNLLRKAITNNWPSGARILIERGAKKTEDIQALAEERGLRL